MKLSRKHWVYLSLFASYLLFLTPGRTLIDRSDMMIYLVSNEIHTDIVIPVRNRIFDWETFLNPNDFASRPSDWIEIGWGDRRFYLEMPTWDKFTFGLAADALLSPDTGIMHVNYLDYDPSKAKHARPIMISYATYEKLLTKMKASFLLKDGRPVILPGKGYSSSDNFYEGVGSFWAFNTCNQWTADVLRSGGIRAPLVAPLKYNIELIWRENE